MAGGACGVGATGGAFSAATGEGGACIVGAAVAVGVCGFCTRGVGVAAAPCGSVSVTRGVIGETGGGVGAGVADAAPPLPPTSGRSIFSSSGAGDGRETRRGETSGRVMKKRQAKEGPQPQRGGLGLSLRVLHDGRLISLRLGDFSRPASPFFHRLQRLVSYPIAWREEKHTALESTRREASP